MRIPKKPARQTYVLDSTGIESLVRNDAPSTAFVPRNVERIINDIHCRRKVSLPACKVSKSFSTTSTFKTYIPAYGYDQYATFRVEALHSAGASDATIAFSSSVDSASVTVDVNDTTLDSVVQTTLKLRSLVPASPALIEVDITITIPAGVTIFVHYLDIDLVETVKI